MRAAVDGAVPGRLLADPHAVLDLGCDGAADGAMSTDVLADFDVLARVRGRSLGLAHRPELNATERRQPTGSEAGPLQEAASVDDIGGEPGREGLEVAAARLAALALDQHGRLTSSGSRSR